MQEHSSKAAHQRYREGGIRYWQINDQSLTVLKDDDSSQVINHYILSGQMVHAAGPVMMTLHLA